MAALPKDPAPDSTLALLREGYAFISNRCRRLDTDAFQARVLGRSVVCARGADAAEMFYVPGRFTRNGAMPKPTLKLLQDEGSVATLDGAAHHHRKAMFLTLLGPERAPEMAERAAEELRQAAQDWPARGRITLHPEFQQILCRAACAWSGLRFDHATLGTLADQLAAMIGNAGHFGPPNWRARWQRRHAERTVRDALLEVRSGRASPPDDSAAHVIAWHRDADGALLSPEVMAVEMLNILRPIVAIARFLTFGVLALHHQPKLRDALRVGGAVEMERFVQEIRRFYPFFPAVAGRVREPFDWHGHHFNEGDLVALDLYGTDHDPSLWTEPDRFRPERFRDWDGNAYGLIPQGGGDHAVNHRCPGEWITIETLKAMLRVMIDDLDYDVPDQDLDYDLGIGLSGLPALPHSGMIIDTVRLRGG